MAGASYTCTQSLGPCGRDVTNRAIKDVDSIVSGRNCDKLTSIIAKLLTSRPFGDLSRVYNKGGRI